MGRSKPKRIDARLAFSANSNEGPDDKISTMYTCVP